MSIKSPLDINSKSGLYLQTNLHVNFRNVRYLPNVLFDLFNLIDHINRWWRKLQVCPVFLVHLINCDSTDSNLCKSNHHIDEKQSRSLTQYKKIIDEVTHNQPLSFSRSHASVFLRRNFSMVLEPDQDNTPMNAPLSPSETPCSTLITPIKKPKNAEKAPS